jgi:ABC-2 type transport system ATP-binding protein
MTNAIEVRALSRRYGGVTALDGVSLDVSEGSITGLLGRNGAGKTTIMSIIAGQDRPTSGRVEVFGRTPFEDAATLQKISFVRDNQRYPDDYRLHHVLRIAPSFAPDWSAQIAEELVDGLRIPAKTPIKKFSRGQLSAVAIVLGLASRAPVTLFDEPYLGLDVTARGLFYNILLRDHTERPRTILLSTHLIGESEGLFDRVVLVGNGRVILHSDGEDTHNLAVQVSGTADAVDRVSEGRTVLRTQRMANLKAVTLQGPADAALAQRAETLGVHVAPASLQDVVAAYGADDAEARTIKDEVSA